jgi:hypothetical protein
MAFAPARQVIQCCGLHGKLSFNALSTSSMARASLKSLRLS